MSVTSPAATAVPGVVIESHKRGADVQGTISFATAQPTTLVITMLGALKTTKTLPVTPAERAAAKALEQAIEGANLTAAHFAKAAAGPVPIGMSRITVAGVGAFDIPIDPKTGTVNAASLPPAQRAAAALIQGRIMAYLHAAEAF